MLNGAGGWVFGNGTGMAVPSGALGGEGAEWPALATQFLPYGPGWHLAEWGV